MKRNLLFVAFALLFLTGITAQQRKAVQLPAAGSGTGGLHYELRVDDAILGEHSSGASGVNYRNEAGVISGPDHRSRNHTVSAWVKRGSKNFGRVLGLTMADRYQMTSLASYFINLDGDFRCKAAVWNADGGLDACAPKNEIRSNRSFAQDEWAFVTAVIDDDNLMARFYANGVLLGQQQLKLAASDKDTYSQHSGTNDHYGIGLFGVDCNFTFGHADLDLAIEEVQVWNRALSPFEVRRSANIDNVSNPETLGLVGLFRCEGEGNSFANIAKGASNVKATVVEGTTRTSGVRYYDGVTPCSTALEMVDAHTLPTKTLVVNTPTSGGSIKVIDMTTGDEAVSPAKQFTPMKVVSTPENGLQLRTVTVTANGVAEQINPLEPLFALHENSEVSATFTSSYAVRKSDCMNGKIEIFIDDAIPSEAATDEFATWLDGTHKVTFKLIPDDGFIVESFSVNGVDFKNSLSENSYTTSTTGENIVATATFRSGSATVKTTTVGSGQLGLKSAGNDIEISHGMATAAIGADLEITPLAADGYALWSLNINGKDVTSDMVNGSYTIDSLDDDISIDVVFKKQKLAVSYRLVDGGELMMSINSETPTPLGNNGSEAPLRSTVKFTPVPVNADSQFESLTVNGQDVTSSMVDGSYTIENLGDDLAVSVKFDVAYYNVAVDVDPEGADLGETVIVNTRYDRSLNTLNESIASGTDIEIVVYFNDEKSVIGSAIDGDTELTPIYDEEGGYKMATLRPSTITSDRTIALRLTDPTALEEIEHLAPAINFDGATIRFATTVDYVVSSVTGATIASATNATSVNIKGVPSGIYVVEAINANGDRSTLKIAKR